MHKINNCRYYLLGDVHMPNVLWYCHFFLIHRGCHFTPMGGIVRSHRQGVRITRPSYLRLSIRQLNTSRSVFKDVVYIFKPFNIVNLNVEPSLLVRVTLRMHQMTYQIIYHIIYLVLYQMTHLMIL